MAATTLAVVATADLGAGFDVGTPLVPGKINPVPATSATFGTMRFATAAEAAAGTAGVVMDAATIMAAIYDANAFSSASTNGVFGVGAATQASYDMGPMSEARTAVSDLGLLSQTAAGAVDLGTFSA